MVIGEVDINSQLPACRNNLIRSSTQDEVLLHSVIVASIATYSNNDNYYNIAVAFLGTCPCKLQPSLKKLGHSSIYSYF